MCVWSILTKRQQMGFWEGIIRSFVCRIIYFMSHKNDMLKLSWKNFGNSTQKWEFVHVHKICVLRMLL